jgi:CRP/FNR family transcriptional regulator
MALVDEYVERLGQAYRTLNLRAFATVQERVAHDLASRAEALGTTEGTALVDVTFQELADAVGSVRDVVARAMRTLKREGIVTTKAGITVIALDRLQDVGTTWQSFFTGA